MFCPGRVLASSTTTCVNLAPICSKSSKSCWSHDCSSRQVIHCFRRTWGNMTNTKTLIFEAYLCLAFACCLTSASRADEAPGSSQAHSNGDHGKRVVTMLPQKSGMKYSDPNITSSSLVDVHAHEPEHDATNGYLRAPDEHSSRDVNLASPSSDEQEEGELSERTAEADAITQDRKSTRPNYYGPIDIVSVGFGVKRFMGVDLKKNTFTIDLVLTYSWTDPRLPALVPEGHHMITFDKAAAKKTVWMPDIHVTNRDFGDLEEISWHMHIYKVSKALIIHRVTVTCQVSLNIRPYPFDRQKVTVSVSAQHAMNNEVQLKPTEDPTRTFVSPDAFSEVGNFILLGSDIGAFDETDGDLKKSRAYLDLKVERRWMKTAQNALLPSALMVVVSWLVLFFPAAPYFTMPRAGGASFSLLTMFTFNIQTTSVLPSSRSDFGWLEFWNECCLNMAVTTVVLNVFMEIVEHRRKLPDFASQILDEGKILYAANAAFTLGASLLIACLYHCNVTDYWMDNLRDVCAVCRWLQILTLAAYIGYTWKRVKQMNTQRRSIVA